MTRPEREVSSEVGRIDKGVRLRSLRWRLPVLICGLLLAVLVVVLYAAYREVEVTLHRAAADRARYAADQVAAMLGRSTVQSFEQLQRIVPEVRKYLRDPSDGHLAAVRATLAPLAPNPSRRIVVWSADGKRMLAVPDPGHGDRGPATVAVPELTQPLEPGIAPLRVAGDRVVTDLGIVVHETAAADSHVVGTISVRAGVALSPPDALSRLVGADARILLGNRRGDLWTDFHHVVPGPAVDLQSDGNREYQSGSGDERIGALSGLSATPWVVWVEFPRGAAVARAQTFMQRMATFGLLVAVAAVLLMRWFTIRVTTPLGAMTIAAEAMAGGDYSRRVVADRRDEIGRLGRAFNSMASQVETDIAGRMHAEAALRASEGRYRTLFDYAPDGILIADADGQCVDANPSMCRMLGFTREQLIGRPPCDVVAPHEAPHIEPALRTVHARADHRREWRLRRQDGSEFSADVIATKMPDGRILGMVRDTTERREATDALRSAEERMRFALQGADVGIWDVDYRTGVFRASDILEGQYGVERGTFGTTFEAFLERIHPGDRKSVRETVEKARRSGADFSLHHRVIRSDGSVRWLTGAGRMHLGEQGEPLRGVGISLDVTERHALEAQYQHAQKMEALGRLAGGVAHDFNNLLTAILGYCELLLASLNPVDPLRADVGEIHKAGTSAAALTRQLLTFSRKQIIETSLVDLNVVVTELQTMLARLIREDIAIVVRLSPEPALVMSDRGQLEQIIMNLAVNARDAMPRGGTLTIETADVELDERYVASHLSMRPGRYVVLTVSDTGTGMTADVQAHLFEPFFTTKEMGRGTGLGLATVHGVAARSGGSVGVYSEVGRGTSIHVYLPQSGGGPLVDETLRPAECRQAGTQTVLVVDDAGSVRRLAQRLLQRQGYRVLLAASAHEALELFEEHESIDLLLTDVVMPGASGPELTRDLLAGRPALKVIYMSGYTDEAIVHHGVLKSGIAFMHKPFTSEALDRKIREVLEGTR
jgi:two-component system cell cycle sensor histidine kinase/response regulator CckA